LIGCRKCIVAEAEDGPQPRCAAEGRNCTNPFERFAAWICPLKIKG